MGEVGPDRARSLTGEHAGPPSGVAASELLPCDVGRPMRLLNRTRRRRDYRQHIGRGD